MIKSILIGLVLPTLIIISGWIRLLFTLISPSFGNGIPMVYLLLGFTFGLGKSYENHTSYWITYISGMLFSGLILMWSSKHDSKSGENSSTVSLCGSGFIIGGLIGMISGLFI